MKSKMALTRKNYNAMSRWYDLFAGSEKHFIDIGVQMLGLQSNERMLEIGCGTGHALAQFNSQGEAYGIDLSEGMLKIAQNRLRKNEANSAAKLLQADGTQIPFTHNTFDAVFLSFTLELFSFEDIPHVLGECRRVLKDGGRIGVVSLAKQDGTAVKIYEWLHRRMPSVIDCRPIHTHLTLEQAGFALIRHEVAHMWGLPVDIIVGRNQVNPNP